jgi:hypothetical protein
MKKLSPRQKKHLLKKSNDTIALRTKRNAYANRERSKKRGYFILTGPEHLSLVKSEPRKKLISFVKSIRRLIPESVKPAPTLSLSPPASTF